MRRAVGDASGLTIKGQIRRAAENLGFAAEGWRLREAWYGRCASAAALDDLRQRYRGWHKLKDTGREDGSDLAHRVRKIRAGLAQLDQQLAVLETDIDHLLSSVQILQ